MEVGWGAVGWEGSGQRSRHACQPRSTSATRVCSLPRCLPLTLQHVWVVPGPWLGETGQPCVDVEDVEDAEGGGGDVLGRCGGGRGGREGKGGRDGEAAGAGWWTRTGAGWWTLGGRRDGASRRIQSSRRHVEEVGSAAARQHKQLPCPTTQTTTARHQAVGPFLPHWCARSCQPAAVQRRGAGWRPGGSWHARRPTAHNTDSLAIIPVQLPRTWGAHSHGSATPHSQREYRMGRPVALSAAPMAV